MTDNINSYFTANTKHLYNISTTSAQRPTLGHHCINVKQFFCVCWVLCQSKIVLVSKRII